MTAVFIARLVFSFPARFLLSVLVVVSLCLMAIVGHLRFDVSLEGLLGEKAAEVSEYSEFIRRFGHDRNFIVSYYDPDLTTYEGLERLSEFQRVLPDIHSSVAGVISLLNHPVTSYRQERAISGSALRMLQRGEHFSVAEWLSKDPALQEYLNARQNQTLLVVDIRPDEESLLPDPRVLAGVLNRLEDVAAEYSRDAVRVGIAGEGAFLGLVDQLMMKDLYLLPAVSIGAALFLLLVIFRRLAGIFFPISVVILPVLLVFTLMAWVEIPVRVTSIIIPPALIVIGIAGAVHVLTEFLQQHYKEACAEQVFLEVIAEKSPALFTAALTTAVAFAVFFSVPLASVSELGILAAAGALATFPSLVVAGSLYIRLINVRPLSADTRASSVMGSGLINTMGTMAARRPWSVISIAVTLLIIALPSVLSLEVSHQPVNWLPTHHQVSRDSQEMQREFAMAFRLEVMLDGGEAGAVMQDEFIKKAEATTALIDGLSQLGYRYRVGDYSGASFTDVARLRLMSPERLRGLFSEDFRYLRISILLPTLEGLEYRGAIDFLNSGLERIWQDPGQFAVTGQPVIMAATHKALKDSLVEGYTLSVLVLTLMMIIFTASLRVGIVLMLPNLLPVVLVTAAMPLFNVPFDLMSMMVMSVAMGLVIDDTVHMTASYQSTRRSGLSSDDAIAYALNSSGRAMFFTTVVMVIGWQALMFSNFHSVAVFGVLVSAVMFIGLLADIHVVPALLKVTDKKASAQ